MLLGLLAMILLLAVAFVTTMRTERLATRNYSDIVAGRNLAHVGLTRAIDYVDFGLTRSQAVYPPVDVIWSTDPASSDQPGPEWVTRNEIIQFVPTDLLVETQTRLPEAEWITIEDPGNSGEVIGRYAFLVVNCSGLADAHAIGKRSRQLGGSPEEIPLDAFPEMASPTNAFSSIRDNEKRFETVGELSSLAYLTSSSKGLNQWPRFLFNYSYFPEMDLDANADVIADPVDLATTTLPGDMNEVLDALMDAGRDSGLPSSARGMLESNLFEYVDAGNVPRDPDGPGTESVPMLNEIYIQAQASPMESNNYVRVGVKVETFYPFVTDESDSYRIEYDLITRPLVAGGAEKSQQVFSQTFNPNPSSARYFVDTTSRLGQTNTAPVSSWAVSVENLKVRNMTAGSDADAVKGRFRGVQVQSLVGVTGPTAYFHAECIDPRFNWGPLDPDHWDWVATARSHTMGVGNGGMDGLNNATRNYLTSHTDTDGQGLTSIEARTLMYVADEQLYQVGDLGYIAYEPWKTVRLYDPGGGTDFERVYDHFYNSTNLITVSTNTFGKGYINPNTRQDTVLAAVFDDMPIDEYAGDPNATRITSAEADNLARAIQTAVPPRGGFKSVSDLGRVSALFDGTVLSFQSELERESVLRNAAEMMRTRQNVFVIFVLAQSGKEPSGSFVVTSEAKAAAIVWRDATLEAAKTEGTFVRLFKWL